MEFCVRLTVSALRYRRAESRVKRPMAIINWYICRRILVLFPAGLLVLTAIIWSTQALQRLDLVSAKGQTFLVFMELTLAAVPFLATVLAPIALVIAMIAVYDALNRDSELVVIAAAGAGRVQLLAPALAAAFVCALIVLAGVVHFGPAGLAKARVMITEVRADVVTSIVQPGRFIEIEDGLTVHIRDRAADGELKGLLLDDRREVERALTYLAETARVVELDGNTLLVMTNGTLERLERPSGELTVVAFDAYGFDLTALASGPVETNFRPSERTLRELLEPDPSDEYRAEREARFTVELYDRLSQPIAPITYALVVFLFVGDPRMYRQNRLAGIFGAGLAVAAVRGASYGVLLAAEETPALAPLVFAVYLGSGAAALGLILSGRSVTVHERVAEGLGGLVGAMMRRRSTTGPTG